MPETWIDIAQDVAKAARDCQAAIDALPDVFADEGPEEIPEEWEHYRKFTLTLAGDEESIRGKANWAVRRMREADAEIARIDKEFAERLEELNQEIQRVQARRDEMAGPAERRKAWLKEKFAGTFTNLLQVTGKASVKLLDGTLKRVYDNKATIRIADEEACRAYCKATGLTGVFVPTVGEKVYITPLKAIWTEKKTVPPGCEEIPEQTHIEVIIAL